MRRVAGLVAALLALAAASASSQEAFTLACSPERPTVFPGESLGVRAWVTARDRQPLTYSWTVSAGELEARGPEARWSIIGVRRGTHAATVTVSQARGASAECVVRVVVRTDPTVRGSDPRETGWSLLIQDQTETPGYGLYSYLLLGAPPAPSARERYLKVIEAYLALVPDIAGLERHFSRHELNVAYVPVTTAPSGAASAEWVLEHYDYARARASLRALGGNRRDGPYLVSALAPLTTRAPAGSAGRHLFQDLSAAPPHLAGTWMKEFLNQAAQERFWDERAGARLALNVRTTVSVLAEGLPEVRKAVGDWIAWTK